MKIVKDIANGFRIIGARIAKHFEQRAAAQREREAGRQKIIDFYHNRGELVPPIMISYLGGSWRQMGYSPREITAEMYRIGTIMRRDEITATEQNAAPRPLRGG